MIRFEHVSKEYPRSGLALQDVSFRLRKAEFCFLTGHSGAGKSTILRLIHMAERPTHGEVHVAGYTSSQVRSREIALLRRKLGFVFQDFRLLPNRTAAENVAFALEVTGVRRGATRIRVSKLLAQVGLASKAESYPVELSGGEQQRVALARAFVNEPRILFADEPTGNLDAETGASVIELLFELNRESTTTVVLVTHDMGLAGRAHRVVRLAGGRIVSDTRRIGAPDGSGSCAEVEGVAAGTRREGA